MECEEAGAPGSAPSSPKGASQLIEVLSTISSVPASEPVKLLLAAEEEQVILPGEPSKEDVTDVLALSRTLTARQH